MLANVDGNSKSSNRASSADRSSSDMVAAWYWQEVKISQSRLNPCSLQPTGTAHTWAGFE